MQSEDIHKPGGSVEHKKKRDKTTLLETCCGLTLACAVAISFSEIIMREVFRISYDFMVDLSVWLTVWALLLLLGPILAEGGHVSVDFLREKARGGLRLFIEIINTFSTIIYGAVITVGGSIFVYKLYVKNTVFPRYFRIPQWIVELCVPIGVFIFTVYALLELRRVIRKKW